MAASVSGSKTVTRDVAPQHSAAVLTTLLAIAPENMTYAQLKQLFYACERVSGGTAPTAVLGTIFT